MIQYHPFQLLQKIIHFLLWNRKLSKFDVCYNCSNFGHLNTGQTIPKHPEPRTIQYVGLATKPSLLLTAIGSSGYTKKIGLCISQYGLSNPVNKSLMQHKSNFYHPSQFYPRVSKSFLCSEVENSKLSENLKTPENINCEKFVYQHRYYLHRYRHHVNNLLKNTQTDTRIYKHPLLCVHHMYPYSPHRENLYAITLNFNL